MTGTCKFCGQTMNTAAETEEEANDYASFYCGCTSARLLREAASAKEKVQELFGENAITYGFRPIADESFINFLDSIIDHIALGEFPAASVLFSGGRAVIKRGGNGKIKVQRASSNRCELES